MLSKHKGRSEWGPNIAPLLPWLRRGRSEVVLGTYLLGDDPTHVRRLGTYQLTSQVFSRPHKNLRGGVLEQQALGESLLHLGFNKPKSLSLSQNWKQEKLAAARQDTAPTCQLCVVSPAYSVPNSCSDKS